MSISFCLRFVLLDSFYCGQLTGPKYIIIIINNIAD